MTMTLQDRFTEQNLAMAVRKRRKWWWYGEITSGNVAVETAEELLERVGKPFIVATRIIRYGRCGWTHQRWVAKQRLVWAITMSDPEFVRRLAVPSEGLRASGDFETQTVLAARCRLRNPHVTLRVVFELQHHATGILRGNVDRRGRFRINRFPGKSFDAAVRTLPTRVDGLQVRTDAHDSTPCDELH